FQITLQLRRLKYLLGTREACPCVNVERESRTYACNSTGFPIKTFGNDGTIKTPDRDIQGQTFEDRHSGMTA
ncbi:TPA: hypothetical protein DEF17_02900, partial [bacterium]|nr:hypothetical protein [bacterium]